MPRVVGLLPGRLPRSLRSAGTSLLLAAVLLLAPGACAQPAQNPKNQGEPDTSPRPVQPAPQGTPAVGGAGADLQRVEDLVLARTNKFRGEQGRGRVNVNPE